MDENVRFTFDTGVGIFYCEPDSPVRPTRKGSVSHEALPVATPPRYC